MFILHTQVCKEGATNLLFFGKNNVIDSLSCDPGKK